MIRSIKPIKCEPCVDNTKEGRNTCKNKGEDKSQKISKPYDNSKLPDKKPMKNLCDELLKDKCNPCIKKPQKKRNMCDSMSKKINPCDDKSKNSFKKETEAKTCNLIRKQDKASQQPKCPCQQCCGINNQMTMLNLELSNFPSHSNCSNTFEILQQNYQNCPRH